MSTQPVVSGAGGPRPSVAVLFAGVFLLMVGNGLLGSVLGVRGDLAEFATTAIGLMMASYYVGFLVGSRTIPRRLAGVGHIRVFSGLASLASTTALLHILLVNAVTWSLLRFVTGLCLAGLYVTIESWLNGRATNATRGRLLSTYMVVVTVGIGSGQLLLGAADVVGPTLFVVSAMLMSLAVVPLALWQVPTPLVEVATRIPIRSLARTAPLGVATGVLVGASNGAIYGLGAVYATKVGMSPGRAGLFVGASMIGAIITQYPLGRLSDRLPRRRVIFTVATAATLAALAGTAIEPEGSLVFLVAALYGSLAFPMYALAVSHINDVARGDQLVATAAGVLFVYGLGSIAGPIVASMLMTFLGPVGYFWSLAGFFSPIVVFSLYRIVTKARPEQQRFVNVSATTPLETRLADSGVDAG